MTAQSPVDGSFALTDHHGRQVTTADFAGRHVVVFFGFTHCQVVCPRALTKLDGVLGRVDPNSNRVQGLYVTVDPERDSPDVMRTFLTERHSRFLGLTGSTAELESARRGFRVFTRRVDDPDDGEGYLVPHTALTYLLDPSGRYLDHFPDHLDEDEIVARMDEHLRVRS